jgi:hypothetical protein
MPENAAEAIANDYPDNPRSADAVACCLAAAKDFAEALELAPETFPERADDLLAELVAAIGPARRGILSEPWHYGRG